VIARVQAAILAALAACVLVAASGCWPAAGPAPRRVSLIATGLSKGNLYPQVRRYSRGRTRTLGGFASIATRVRELVAERTGRGGALVVDLGGNLAGSAESLASRGSIVVDMMNQVPYSASLVSNLEFAFGQQVLESRVAEARFPFLATNVSFAAAGPGAGTAPEAPPRPPGASGGLAGRVRREVTVVVEGMKVALVGISPPNLLQITAPEAAAGVTVDADLRRVVDEAARAKASGAALVVALAKVPVDRPPDAVRAAIAGSPIDVVLGIDYLRGDSGVKRWGDAWVAGIPADIAGARVLVVDLELTAGRVTAAEADAEIVAPEVTAPDPAVAQALDRYEREHLAPMRAVVATASTPLERVHKAESTLGNVVTDAMMRRAPGAQLALLNSGAIQDDLVAGPITARDLVRVLPFDNTIVTLPATGRQIETLIQEILDRGSRYHVSGGGYRVQEGGQGTDRLLALSVGGRPATSTTTYVLATTDYIARRSPGLAARPTVHGSLRDALADHLRAHAGPVAGRIEGRVVFERPPPGPGR
jgi:2',3'-cyclic-nucleotide 2'-phosphodiesterase (5'-nucleotidase family)